METRDLLRLTIGPLRYDFRAHDAWGEDALARLRAHVVCVPFDGRADRVLHLIKFRPTKEEYDEINAGHLPHRLVSLFPKNAAQKPWKMIGDKTGYMTFWHCQTPHSVWTFGTVSVEHDAPFQLPWPLLFDDVLRRGGGILHGGMASLGTRGFLFLAPPGGGKTTAISRVHPPWRVWADDAALIWPETGKGFLASPLPTWSALLGRSQALAAIGSWEIGRVIPISGAFFMEKGRTNMLIPIRAISAAPRWYRALVEHPYVLSNRGPHRRQLFQLACGLANAARAWRLVLTLDDEFSVWLNASLTARTGAR